jgi:hypothetical protein
MSPSQRTRPFVPARDQRESAFSSILATLLSRFPGARACALVDAEGETVDYAGRMAPFDLRVAAAHWRIVADQAACQRSYGEVQRLVVRGGRRSVVVQLLPDGYALVIVRQRLASLAISSRALPACIRALGDEAGWTWQRGSAPSSWFGVDALVDGRFRPAAVVEHGEIRELEILGALASGLSHRERGWRVRFDSGIEATLVREPGQPTAWRRRQLPAPSTGPHDFASGSWYCDEPINGPALVNVTLASASILDPKKSFKKALTGRPR